MSWLASTGPTRGLGRASAGLEPLSIRVEIGLDLSRPQFAALYKMIDCRHPRVVLVPPTVDAQQPILVVGEVLAIGADRSEIGVGKFTKLWRQILGRVS